MCIEVSLNNRIIYKIKLQNFLYSRQPGLLVARFGEWNTANNNEPSPFQESTVQAIVTHPQYYNGGLYHDVAVLILATPVTYAVNIMPICMPQQGMTFQPGTRCLASGWGRSAFSMSTDHNKISKKKNSKLIFF